MFSENFMFEPANMIRVEFPQIGRTQRSDLYTMMTRRDYRACFEKGRIRPNMETLPFGHVNYNEQQRHEVFF